MEQIERRNFLKVGVVGSGAAAVAGLAGSRLAGSGQAGRASADGHVVSFHAVAGLPQPPLHSHFVHDVTGVVNLATGLGTVTTRVLAGPLSTPGIALPGLTRVIRVTSATTRGSTLMLRGTVEGRSLLGPRIVQFTVDQASGTVLVPVGGRAVKHLLAP